MEVGRCVSHQPVDRRGVAVADHVRDGDVGKHDVRRKEHRHPVAEILRVSDRDGVGHTGHRGAEDLQARSEESIQPGHRHDVRAAGDIADDHIGNGHATHPGFDRDPGGGVKQGLLKVRRVGRRVVDVGDG